MRAESIATLSIVTLIFRISDFSINNPTPPLKHILCIYYLLYFEKDKSNIKILIDSNSEVNAMTPIYVFKLGFKVHYINIQA